MSFLDNNLSDLMRSLGKRVEWMKARRRKGGCALTDEQKRANDVAFRKEIASPNELIIGAPQ
jgi:hypothetical protein